MPPPTTVSDFLELVHKSGLVDPARLHACLDPLMSADLLPGTPHGLAALLIRHGLVTHFQAEQFLNGKCRGMMLGHSYKVLERLGHGGMALVYLCEDIRDGRRVAIKVLPTAYAQTAEYLKRFYREALATALLDHPNIVRAYEVDQDESRHFLVMEYIEGCLLQDLVKKHGALDVYRACNYIRQAALGLQHAHEQGLVHRDIKPENLIVDRSGTVKILDLGLARFRDSDEVLTTGVLGTPDYLAPEQTQDSHRVDIRADIYSLGGTFYFLLTGSTPFGEGSVAKKLMWHLTRDPTPVGLLRPDVPLEIEVLVMRMMAKDPFERFQEPAEVAEALDLWTQEPVPPPSDDELPRLSSMLSGDTDPDFSVTPGPGSARQVVRRPPGSDPRHSGLPGEFGSMSPE